MDDGSKITFLGTRRVLNLQMLFFFSVRNFLLSFPVFVGPLFVCLLGLAHKTFCPILADISLTFSGREAEDEV